MFSHLFGLGVRLCLTAEFLCLATRLESCNLRVDSLVILGSRRTCRGMDLFNFLERDSQ